jgi:CubicO group peptidase (beta-lactamase class C family)
MTRINRRSFLIGALGAASAVPAAFIPADAAAAEPLRHRSAEIDVLVARERAAIIEAMARAGIEGAAVCFIHNGAPVWVEGFGVTDRSSGNPVQVDTIFSIQSTSKNLTAAAILIAVQAGILDLDEPITTYVPDFVVQSRFESAPQSRMTLRLLLSHRAGFTHEASVGNNYDAAFPNFEAHVRSIRETWLRYPVGERYRYSNLGYDLAGHILQVRSSMSFAEFLRTRLFEPLGMADSTVAPEIYERRQNRAVGHDVGHPAVPLKTPLIPSGGVYTSARDMAAYALFHLNRGKFGGRVVLREDLWEQMHGFALGGDYGLGVIRTELRYGETPLRLLSHKGGGFGFGSVFYYCPQSDLGWAALFNRTADAAYGFGRNLIDAALIRRYGMRKPRLTPLDLAPIQQTPAQLERFVGTWIGRNATVAMQIRNGVLQYLEDRAATPIQFASPDEALRVGADGEIRVYRYFAAQGDEPAHLECSEGEISLDYDDGPHGSTGPDNAAWTRFVGRYQLRQWGIPVQTLSIQRRNGWLYLDDIRLVAEPEQGLFFTCDGEAIDFRGEQATWKNLRMERMDQPDRAAALAPSLGGTPEGRVVLDGPA